MTVSDGAAVWRAVERATASFAPLTHLHTYAFLFSQRSVTQAAAVLWYTSDPRTSYHVLLGLVDAP